MEKKKENNKLIPILIFIIITYIIIKPFFNLDGSNTKRNDSTFRILASTSTEKMDEKLIKHGKKNGIKVEIEHYGELPR